MITSDSSTEHRNCLRCGRGLRSSEAVARGYGSGCWAKMRQAARTPDLSQWTASQVEEARQAIEDAAIIPSNREGVYHVVSSDGSEVHLTHRDACNCVNGLSTRPPRPCWHRCVVAIVLAASAPQTDQPVVTRPVPLAPAGTSPRNIPALPAPAAPQMNQPVVPLAPAGIWAELEALGALAGAAAPF